jgi:HAD superfamily hydrolase (TIGR01549 family)
MPTNEQPVPSTPKLHGIRAVVFDAFGTMVEITRKHRPYRAWLERLRAAGHTPGPDDNTKLMTANVGLAGAAGLFGVSLPAAALADLELHLYEEMASLRLYHDVSATLNGLRARGLKIAVCSNLAAPYAVPVKLLLPIELDVYAWSFAIGAIKPNPAIYRWCCEALQCAPAEVIMVGDTLDSDCLGPRDFGMHGFHLSRHRNSPSEHMVDSLTAVLELVA